MPREAKRAVLQELARVEKGDFLEVEWLDAATVKDARIEKLPLPNNYVETRRRTYGVFICVQKSATWYVPVLTLLMDQIDDKSIIRTIPVPVIMQLKLKVEKTPESVDKAVQAYKRARRALKRGKSRVTCKDGAFKVLS